MYQGGGCTFSTCKHSRKIHPQPTIVSPHPLLNPAISTPLESLLGRGDFAKLSTLGREFRDDSNIRSKLRRTYATRENDLFASLVTVLKAFHSFRMSDRILVSTFYFTFGYDENSFTRWTSIENNRYPLFQVSAIGSTEYLVSLVRLVRKKPAPFAPYPFHFQRVKSIEIKDVDAIDDVSFSRWVLDVVGEHIVRRGAYAKHIVMFLMKYVTTYYERFVFEEHLQSIVPSSIGRELDYVYEYTFPVYSTRKGGCTTKRGGPNPSTSWRRTNAQRPRSARHLAGIIGGKS